MDPHPIPHRQLDQLGSTATREATRDLLTTLAEDWSPQVRVDRSRLERRGDALYRGDLTTATWLRATRGELGHVHPSDGSLHVALPPADAAVVVRSGWGERHGLAGVPGLGLPLGYLLVYAPRDDAELEVVGRIVHRAAGLA